MTECLPELSLDGRGKVLVSSGLMVC